MADIQLAASAVYEAAEEWGATGATLGMRVVDNAGATTVARVTGFTEYPAGSGVYYRGANTAPSVAGEYTLVFDDDAGTAAIGHVSTQTLLVTSTPTYAAPSGTAYVSAATLKATLSMSGETFADADVAVAVEAASRGIDDACGRRFYLDANASQIRYFTPISADVLAIDDLTTLTTLKTDTAGDGTFATTLVTNTDFTLAPLNAAADSQPYTMLMSRTTPGLITLPTYYGRGSQDYGRRSVQITGRFGWPTVPAPIVQATTILAGRLLKRAREAPFGVVALGLDAAGRIARTDPDVLNLIGPYQKWRPNF